MHQHISNNKWVIAAIAVVVLLGALAFGAALAGASGSGNSGGGGDESREPVTVIERTVIQKEADQDATKDGNNRGVSQGPGQGTGQAAQNDDQADGRDEHRGSGQPARTPPSTVGCRRRGTIASPTSMGVHCREPDPHG
jgi:hypothetical protein